MVRSIATLIAAALAFGVLTCSPANAAPSGPFAEFGGNYSGKVRLTSPNVSPIPGTAKIAVQVSPDGSSAILRVTGRAKSGTTVIPINGTLQLFGDFKTFTISDLTYNTISKKFPGVGKFSGQRSLHYSAPFYIYTSAIKGRFSGTVNFRPAGKKRNKLVVTSQLKTSTEEFNFTFTVTGKRR